MDTPREVRDDGRGTAWSCVTALAAAGTEGKVPVVCTPSGGERSVRLELATDWRGALSDEALLAAIAAGRG